MMFEGDVVTFAKTFGHFGRKYFQTEFELNSNSMEHKIERYNVLADNAVDQIIKFHSLFAQENVHKIRVN
jgi:hypothetical protein